ncbi:transforming acidic coiled-coil-containing protein 3-like [Polyodon spathula]|uniref:transforming acidic coiled-coil-containing protein 3-like n=1 Tax=Polyodon spathula TaxID=7913 RepID=UPI001B7F2DAB|nr:transforming acidic coiled-coil-containing protein 3-like [Polyodon spathula]XP_041124193.1 transforming acidic coiled-coil-containing protein 3-like [Polyodon spathula]
MSLTAVNDENLGVDPSSNCVSSETCNFLCLSQQPTGRPSILRPSQKENMPLKSLKDVKVCFQTPMRDPVTRKIISSASKLESNFSLDDCTKALEKLSLETNQAKTADTSAHIENKNNQDSECKADANCINTASEVPCPDELPVQSKGAYTIDFDHLDSINPFKSGGGQMGISTPKVGNSPVKVSKTPEQKKSLVKVTSPENITQGELSLEDTLPVTPRLDNSIPEIKPQKLVETTNDTSSPVSVKTDASSTDLSCDVPGEGAETVVSKASYNLDLDNLDRINPFSSSNVNSPQPPIGSYNFDIDVDSIDPFKCGGSKLQNSPIGGGSKPPIESSSLMEDVPKKLEYSKPLEASNCLLKKDELVNLEYSRPMTETSLPVTDEPVNETSKPPTETSSPVKDQPMKLEFNFDDGKAKKKPPKNLGKRPPGSKLSAKKPVASTEIGEPPKMQEVRDKPADDNIPFPKAYHNFELDMLDDPNLNPFRTDAKVNSSPKLEAVEKVEDASPVSELPKLECHEKPIKDESSAVPTSTKVPTLTENATPAAEELVPEPPSNSHAIKEDTLPLDHENLTAEMPTMRRSVTESFMDCTASNHGIATDESFRPGTDFLASGFDEPVDYLEQFGSSMLKESVLRKQSLYLKFDPLLKESPKKSLPTVCNGIPLPCSVLSRFDEVWDLPAGVENKVQSEQKPKELNIFETSPVDGTAPLVCVVPSAINSLVPDSSLPTGNAEDPIIEVLKYSQKDMDAAIEEVRREVQEKQKVIDEWQDKYNKLRADYVIMETIVAEFESTIAQIVDDDQKQKEAAIAEIQKVNEEKQQVLLDLSSMEKSFSDLFKRFDKQKEVIEGYRKNEETLKRCAQEYLSRIKKEEQRYQTLKAHAEEKISLANEEIAQVRTKSKAETAALQATLRREQMKIQSLDRSLEQKAKENEELTKLCDELIMNVQKGGARQ